MLDLQEGMFTLLTGETQEGLYEGRLFTCTVVGIVRRKPPREVLEWANPIQDEYSRMWKCPFCLKDDFRDIGLVRLTCLHRNSRELHFLPQFLCVA